MTEKKMTREDEISEQVGEKVTAEQIRDEAWNSLAMAGVMLTDLYDPAAITGTDEGKAVLGTVFYITSAMRLLDALRGKTSHAEAYALIDDLYTNSGFVEEEDAEKKAA